MSYKTGRLKNKAIYSNGCSCLYFRVVKVQFESERIVKAKGQLIDEHGNVHEFKNYKLVKANIGDWYEVD